MIHNFNPTEFLSQHWQKSPCLIKNAFSRPPNYVSADELAGLALEEEVESRIISNLNGNWRLFHGPFDESDFAELPESNWTLLVQTLDHWLPEVQPFLKNFNFVPRWRFDDLMVSFASNGGGVGPHYDNYDVFLIQASGERRWRVGQMGETLQGQTVIDGLKHLKEFTPYIDVVMQPGDMLYIPPDTPHWGESIGDSIGYSVGFRAPQSRDLLSLLAEHFEQSCAGEFFPDPYRATPNSSSKIEPELIDWARKELLNIANNQELIELLLSNSLSQTKLEEFSCDEESTYLEEEISLEKVKTIQLAEGLNANWVQQKDRLIININGETVFCHPELAPNIETLISGDPLIISGLEPLLQKFAFSNSLTSLINKGLLLVDY